MSRGDGPNPGASPGRAVATLALTAVIALAALGACGYRFGVADQVQYLTHYVAMRFPGALAGDPYAEAFGSLGSFAWAPIAWTTPQPALPWVTLGVMLASVTASGLVLIALGRSLLGPRAPMLLAAAPALVLVVPKEQNYLGLVSLGDVEMTATILVMPLVFASMTLFARGRAVWSLVAALAAAPVHGQTAAYLLGAWCVATLVAHRRETAMLALVGAVGAAGAVGVWLARSMGPVPGAQMEAYARLGHELYAPLIDVRRVPVKSWAALMFVLSFGAVAAPGYLRAASKSPTTTRSCRERLLVYAAGSLVFPALGLALLSMGLEEPLLWRLMVSRSLMLVQIVSLVVAGVWAAEHIARGGRGVLLGVVALAGLALWPTPQLGHLAAGVVGLATLGAIGLGALPRPRGGIAESSARSTLGAAPALAAVIASGAAGALASGFSWVSSPAAPGWLDAQSWARQNTPEGSVFLAPPYLSGWRVGSHRPSWGELRDGGLFFYAGEPALGWEARMRALGMRPRAWWFEIDPRDDDETHAPLRAAYADAVRTRLGEIEGVSYLVIERGDAPQGRSPVYQNELFEIYELDAASRP